MCIPVCMCVYACTRVCVVFVCRHTQERACMQVPTEARKSDPMELELQGFVSSGTDLLSSARAASTLKHGASFHPHGEQESLV